MCGHSYLQPNWSQLSYLPESWIPLYLSGCSRPCRSHLCFAQWWQWSCGWGDLNHKRRFCFAFFRSITCLNICCCSGGWRSNLTLTSNTPFQLDLSCMGTFKAFSSYSYSHLMLYWTYPYQRKPLSISTCPSINSNRVSWFLIIAQWIYLFLSFGQCWKIQRTLFVNTQIGGGENRKVHIRPVVTVISQQ